MLAEEEAAEPPAKAPEREGLAGDPPSEVDAPRTSSSFKSKLLLPKLLYATFFGGLSCLTPFLPLYYASVGIDDQKIGVLACIPSFILVVAGPVWGLVADRFKGSAKGMFLVMMVLYVFIRLLLLWFDSFAELFLLLVVSEFIGQPLYPLVDNAVLQILAEHGDKREYGKERLWGAVGWGLFALIAGWLITATSIRSAFYAFAALLLLAVAEIALLFDVRPDGAKPELKTLLRFATLANASFYLLLFFMGIAYSVIASFLFLHLQSLGGDAVLFGLSLTVTCIAELPVFWFSSWMLEKMGVHGVLMLTVVCYILRLMYYSFLTQPWLVLLSEPLHGITFGAGWAASIAYSDQIAPEGLGATSQGLSSSIYMGLGCGVGSLVGGFVYQRKGAATVFLGAAALLFVAGTFYALSQLWLARRQNTAVAPAEEEMELQSGDAVDPGDQSAIAAESNAEAESQRPSLGSMT